MTGLKFIGGNAAAITFLYGLAIFCSDGQFKIESYMAEGALVMVCSLLSALAIVK